MNTKASGNIGEECAAAYLRKAGYKILERNAVYGNAEVDIIAEIKAKKSIFKSESTTVFCEVKTRTGAEYGTAAEAVTPYKIGKYVTAAKVYAQAHGMRNIRFDVICVFGGEVEQHIENAFSSEEARYAKRR